MKPDELLKELEGGTLRPVYLLFGEEDLLREETFARVKEAALKGAMIDFNYDLFHGGEVEISRVLAAASTLPVMAPRRLVVLKSADRLKAAEEEELLAYLKDPSPSTTLLLVAREVDKRKRLYLALNKGGGAVEHSRPYEKEMPRWIKWLARKRDLEISEAACRYLVDIIGNDLGAVANELEKVALYAGGRKRIDVEDIEAIAVDVKARTVFQLIDALGTKDLQGALEHMGRLFDGGESPILILSMIARQLRLIWTGIDLLKQGKTEADVKKRVKIPPFALQGYLRQIRLFKEGEVRSAYERLYELDLKFKSSRIDKEKALELLLFSLCRKA